MIDENKLDQLRNAINDLSRIVDEAEQYDTSELTISLKHMEVTINDFLDEVHALDDTLSEAEETAADADEEAESAGEEDDEEED